MFVIIAPNTGQIIFRTDDRGKVFRLALTRAFRGTPCRDTAFGPQPIVNI